MKEALLNIGPPTAICDEDRSGLKWLVVEVERRSTGARTGAPYEHEETGE